ncbi:MAG TPA: YceI family protein [Lysobacter sp.]
MRLRLLLAAALLPTPALAEDFAIDPVHTRVMVAVGHAGFSRALGTVSGGSGRVSFGDGWKDAHVDVAIPLGRLDFGDADWNRAVHRLLGTARTPVARFVSDRVTARDATRAEVCGTLTLHGTSRPLCMQATLNALRRHPLPPFRRTLGVSATATLDRFDYGIDDWPTVIGRDVELRIELEASRGLGAPRAAATRDEESGQ